MKRTFICPQCGARNRIEASNLQDNLATCTSCEARFRLPSEADAAQSGENKGFGSRDTEIVDMRGELADVRDLPTYVGNRDQILETELDADSLHGPSQTDTLLFSKRSASDASISVGNAVLQPPPVTDTQSQYVAHGTRWRMWGITFLGAFVLTVLIWAGFMMAARGSAKRFDVTMTDGLRGIASERTRQLAGAVVLTMAEGTPDVSHQIVQSFVHAGTPQDLFVIRTDGTEAFNSNDWSTYKSVVQKLCKTDDSEQGSDEVGSFAKRVRRELLTGGDARLQELGDDPCVSVESATTQRHPPGFPGGLPPNIFEQLSDKTDEPYRGWVEQEGSKGKRTLVVVHPIVGDEKCQVCHEKPLAAHAGIYGLVVSRTSLAFLDSVTKETRDSAMLAAGGVTLFAIVILLSVILLIRRRQDA